MYHTVDIATLSPKQISRILNGHAVRVKMGSGAKMHVSTEHAKKLHRANLKGGAATVTLDPYAIQHNQHLRTHVGRIAHKARGGTLLIDEPITTRQVVNSTGRFFQNPGKTLGFGFEGPLPSPDRVPPTPTQYRGRGPKGLKKFKKWTGAIGDFLRPVAKPILEAATHAAVREIGKSGGMRGRGPKGLKKFKKWTGAIGDFLKPVAKPILEAATHAAVREIGKSGQGMHGDGFFEDLGRVAKSAGKKVVKQIANEVVQYAGPAAGTAFASAATAAGQPQFAPAAALLGNKLGTRYGRYANERIQGMGGTLLIDEPFTTREAVNTTGNFFKNPGKTLGFGAKKPKRVMSEAQKAALAKGRHALRIKLNEMGAGSGGAARPAGYGMQEYC